MNAAILAAEIIAVATRSLAEKLARYKEELEGSMAEKSEKAKREFKV